MLDMNNIVSNKKIFVIASCLFLILFSCKHNGNVSTISDAIVENQPDFIIENIDISDVDNENDRSTLLRMDSLNHLLGKDIYVTKEDFYKYRETKVTLIGDSIADGAKGSITKYFKNIMIDSVPGREIKKVFEVYNVMEIYKRIGDMVIISLGTNAINGIEVDKLEDVYKRLEGKPMFLLSIVIPYKGQERNRNRDIKRFVETHKGCYLIDYHKVMKNHPEYFNEDKVHPNGAGSEVYAQLLFKSVCDYLKTK